LEGVVASDTFLEHVGKLRERMLRHADGRCVHGNGVKFAMDAQLKRLCATAFMAALMRINCGSAHRGEPALSTPVALM